MIKHLSLLLLPAALCAASVFAAADPAALDVARKLFDTPGKPAEARAAFEKIAAADPKNAEALRALAELALRRDDAEKAIAYAEKAVALAPDNDTYQTTLGDAYGRAAQKASIFSQPGLAKKCLAAYLRAAELAPNNVRRHLNLFEFYRQAPSFAGGGTEKALAEAAVIKKLDPLQGSVAFATLYVADQKYALALAEFDEVLKTNPDDLAALYQVGKLAAVSGQFLDRGLASLRRGLALPPPASPNAPGRPAVHYRIGQILELKKDLAGARAAYKAALELDPKFTPAAESLKKLK